MLSFKKKNLMEEHNGKLIILIWINTKLALSLFLFFYFI